MFRNYTIILWNSPVSFIVVPPPFLGLKNVLHDHFFLVWGWRGVPENMWWCPPSAPYLSVSVVPIGKCNNQQIPLLHADWNSFRNSINSGPPFWNQAPADSSQIPPRLCALCCTCFCCLHLVSLIFLFCSYDRSLQQENVGCRAGPGAVRGSLSPALCVQR